VLFLGWIADAIADEDFLKIWIYLIVLFVFVLINYLVKVFYKPTNFRIFRDVALFLEKQYLQKFIFADNNQVEKI